MEINVHATPKMSALQQKTAYLKRTPLKDLTDRDFWYLTQEDQTKFGSSNDIDEQDPFAYNGIEDGEELKGVADTRANRPKNPVKTIKRIRWTQRILLISCCAATAPLAIWPAQIYSWALPVCVLWILAWIFSSWLTRQAHLAFKRSVAAAFTQARSARVAWKMVRWLGSAYEFVKHSPVLIKRFDGFAGVADQTDPNGFDSILYWLREAAVHAQTEFGSQKTIGSTTKKNVVTAEIRYNELIDQARNRIDSDLRQRWMWEIENLLLLISFGGAFSCIVGPAFIYMKVLV
jgi:hypothetical protein